MEGILSVFPNEMRFLIFSHVEDWNTYSSASRVNHRWKVEIEHAWRAWASSLGYLEYEEFWSKHGRSWKWVGRCAMKKIDLDTISDDVLHWGTIEQPSSYVYHGDLVGQSREGLGVCVFARGDKYMGEWKCNEYSGSGWHYYNSNGCIYDGQWSQGVKKGYGECVWKEGDCYKGTWNQNMQEGKGVHTWPAGEKYEGDFEAAKQAGYGVFYWPNGDRFEGQWKDDLRHGKATYIYANGGKYKGEYIEDERSGYGTFEWPDGDVYTGKWANGGRKGPGVLRLRDGREIPQEWCEPVGINYSTTLPLKFPNENNK
eukprot:TRINITY_DN8207_c0_g1_i1.p1 TRINITY_DN8207_c0_g1~~TRINITY_DN8207_c0_g1_i1.p1  ORF type:complete len:347 (+),score=94.76 TRINITY_DN8207_c0_g1_i1:105-1043(+)